MKKAIFGIAALAVILVPFGAHKALSKSDKLNKITGNGTFSVAGLDQGVTVRIEPGFSYDNGSGKVSTWDANGAWSQIEIHWSAMTGSTAWFGGVITADSN